MFFKYLSTGIINAFLIFLLNEHSYISVPHYNPFYASFSVSYFQSIGNCCCVAYSTSSIAETRDSALSFF